MRPPQTLELSAEQRALVGRSARSLALALPARASGGAAQGCRWHGAAFRWPDTACCARARAIRSTAGWVATARRVSRAYGFAKDAGASPLFPPRHADAETAKDALLQVVRRDPRTCGVPQSRWRLADLVEHGQWLNLETESGMSQLLKRVGIHSKRGRDHVQSPDPSYQAKIEEISALKKRLEEYQGKEILL